MNSLAYAEPFPATIKLTVECHRCGLEEVKPFPESVSLHTLNEHLCDACKVMGESEVADDGMTMDKMHALIEQTTGVRLRSEVTEILWKDYLNANMNGKSISCEDFIDSLGIDAWKS